MRSCRAGISSCLLTKGNKKSRGEFPATPARPCGSSKQRATTQPVRRAFPNSPAHAVSNTWKGSFFVAAHATAMRSNKKSPHEPRRKILRALPGGRGSAQWPTACLFRFGFRTVLQCPVEHLFEIVKAFRTDPIGFVGRAIALVQVVVVFAEGGPAEVAVVMVPCGARPAVHCFFQWDVQGISFGL